MTARKDGHLFKLNKGEDMSYLIAACLIIAGVGVIIQENNSPVNKLKKDVGYLESLTESINKQTSNLKITVDRHDFNFTEQEQLPYTKKLKKLLKVKHVTRDGNYFYFHNKKESEIPAYGGFYPSQYKKHVYLTNLKSEYESLLKTKQDLECDSDCTVKE